MPTENPTEENKSIVPKPKWFAGNLIPRNFDDAMKLSHALCKSGLVPKEMIGKPENCFISISFGMELGLPPMQAIQSIMTVNGRPCVWGDSALALVFDSGLCELLDEDPADKAIKQGYGRCRVKRVNGTEKEVRFSVEDAKKARLWTKSGPWQDYPGRMLQLRARSWALRDNFPDVLKGLSVREEVADIPSKPRVVMPRQVGDPKPDIQNVEEAQIVEHEIPQQEVVDALNAEKDKFISPGQRKELIEALSKYKINLKDWKKYVTETIGVASSAEIPADKFGDVVSWIDSQSEKEPVA